MATDDIGGTPEFGGPPPGDELSNDAKNWAMLSHLAGLAGYVAPGIANVVAPLIVWLIKKDAHPFVDDQGKEALNFQITMSIAIFVSFLLCFVLIGFLLLPIVVVFHLVMTIVGAVKASNGQWYRYPISIRLVK
jgi:uncharacterized Tic20 family protein